MYGGIETFMWGNFFELLWIVGMSLNSSEVVGVRICKGDVKGDEESHFVLFPSSIFPWITQIKYDPLVIQRV